MKFDFSCITPCCAEIALGQCLDNNEPYGRLVCDKHLSDSLCHDCAITKQIDQRYYQYVSYCEVVDGALEKKALHMICNYELGIVIAVLLGGIFKSIILLGILLTAWIVSAYLLLYIRKKLRLNKICKTLPDFKKLYKAWENKKREEALSITDSIITAIMSCVFTSELSEKQLDLRISILKFKLDMMK